MTARDPVTIDFFSDVLCIWAYIAEQRIAEVERQFGETVLVVYKFCSVFGNTADRIERGWSAKGGYAGFNRHLMEVSAKFDGIEAHPDIWIKTKPASSGAAHLFGKAVQLLEAAGEIDATATIAGKNLSQAFISELRRAFFVECRDVGAHRVLYEVAEELGISRAAVEGKIDSGAAFAALAADYQEQQDFNVEGSPSFVLNEGRQKLYGNVGYHLIEANIRELLREPGIGEMSWC